jgi:FkbM family methyltransferase
MKNRIMSFLQKLAGLENYYFYFSCFKIFTLNLDKRKRAYNFFVKLLSQNDTVLIAGGFIGITTIPIVKQCKFGHIYVFEPVVLNVKVLERIKRFFNSKQLTITHGALGDVEKELVIKTPIINGAVYNGMSHLENLDYLSTKDYIEGKTKVYKGDQFISQYNIKLNAIKLVAENFEFEIYQGLIETIKRDRPLIYTELWDLVKRTQIFDFFQTLNYQVYILNEQNHLASFKKDIDLTKFFILIPQEKADQYLGQ